MSKAYHFSGSLEDMSLPEMFASIDRHRVPGVVEIRRDDVEKRIFLHEGNVIHASSTDRSDRLGAHLYRLGLLDREQLVETIRLRDEVGKRYGQVLIEEGLLAPSDLYETLRSQVRSIVWSVFSWKRGELTFDLGAMPDPSMVRIHVPVRQMIVQGIKKAPDAKALIQKLGSKETVFTATYCTEDLIAVSLDREEYDLLRLVNGERTLYEICSEGPYGVSENARLLYAYRILGLIATTPEPGAQGVKIQMGNNS
jgi:hypothetical protein